ncbi:MAG: hypothetical protein IT435_16965 [Phycisphaerales bacterium]|nr:hypothetical protein [Phycisphaerales bacterium]
MSVLAPVSFAQSFNVDIGNPGSTVPTSAYGGGASQTGFWNLQVGLLTGAKEVSGNSTGVTFYFDGNRGTLEVPGAGDDDQKLIEDYSGASSVGSSMLQVAGLMPGQYRAFVYGWAGSLFGDFQSVFDFVDPQTGSKSRAVVDYNAAWPGHQILGETYCTYDFAITGNQTLFVVAYFQGTGEESQTSVINGLQIVQIPAPSALGISGIMLAAGRRRR